MTLDTPASAPPQDHAPRLFAVPGQRIERHLVIVHQPGWQAVEDWHRIAAKIIWIDPATAVFVVPYNSLEDRAVRMAAERPTLVVSAGPLGLFAPARGKVYYGRPIAKFEQLRRLAAAGVWVPKTIMLTPQLELDPDQWGRFVIVKPTDIGSSSHGNGIQLMRTERVRFIPPEHYPPDHPGRRGPMLVQQYIDTGPKVSAFRVLTLLGEPLYCQLAEVTMERPAPDAPDEVIEAAIIATQGGTMKQRKLTFVHDADVIAAARAAHRAVPEVPLKGTDVIRDERTGRVYVLELNPGGNTWHFSSAFLASSRAARGARFERLRQSQFDAFSTAAHVLAEKTRTDAV